MLKGDEEMVGDGEKVLVAVGRIMSSRVDDSVADPARLYRR